MKTLFIALMMMLVGHVASAAESANGGSDAPAADNGVQHRPFNDTCKFSVPGNQPTAGCTDEDLCAFASVRYADACKRVAAKSANANTLIREQSAIQSATGTSDDLFSVEDDCKAKARVIGKGAALASVVPFTVKEIQNGDPMTRGWDIVGEGAKEVEVTRCRFWFKKR